MSATLASVIRSPELGEGWRLPHDHPIARFHVMFWGKSIEDEQHVAQGSTPDAGGDEVQDEDDEYNDPYEDDEYDDPYDDVIPGCHTMDLGDGMDGITIPRIWIRADYIRIYKAIEGCYSLRGHETPSAVVTGQPGVGKSIWIFYALRRRLAERKSVIWYYKGDYYLFVEEGVYKLPADFRGTDFKIFVWTLVDADESPECVPLHLVPHATRLYVIYSTYPDSNRWSSRHQTLSDIVVIMKPWTIEEILRVAPPAIERDRIREVFGCFGPTPRICIEYLENSEKLDEYKRQVDKAILGMTPLQLGSMEADACEIRMNAISEKLFLISREKRNDVHSPVDVEIIAPAIKTRLARRFQKVTTSAEQVRLYKAFAGIQSSS